MGCQSLEELFELYLLGALGREDGAAVEEHLARGCPHCSAPLREATLTIYLLAQPTRIPRLNPKHKLQLLRRVRKP